MAASPIVIDKNLSLYPQIRTFNNIDVALNESNSKFKLRLGIKLTRIFFITNVPNQFYKVKIYRRYVGTDKIKITELLYEHQTTENFNIVFDPIKVLNECDEIWFEMTNAHMITSFGIEFNKWSN